MKATLTVHPIYGKSRIIELDYVDLLQIQSALKSHSKLYKQAGMDDCSKSVNISLGKVSSVMKRKRKHTKKIKS